MEYILNFPQCVARFPFIPRGRRLHIGSIRARAGCPCLAPAIDGSWRSLGTVRTLLGFGHATCLTDCRFAQDQTGVLAVFSLYYQRIDRGWPAVQSQPRAAQAAPGPGAGATLTPRHVHRSDQSVRPRDPPRSYHRRPEIDDIRLSDRSVGHRLYALNITAWARKLLHTCYARTVTSLSTTRITSRSCSILRPIPKSSPTLRKRRMPNRSSMISRPSFVASATPTR